MELLFGGSGKLWECGGSREALERLCGEALKALERLWRG
jgi:hypothetical protein